MSAIQSIRVDVDCRSSSSCEGSSIGSPTRFSSSEKSITEGVMLLSIEVPFACSCCQQLTIAPKIATAAQNHHERPEYPSRRPAACTLPARRGPIVRARHADDCPNPFNVPRVLFEGAAATSIRDVDGYDSD